VQRQKPRLRGKKPKRRRRSSRPIDPKRIENKRLRTREEAALSKKGRMLRLLKQLNESPRTIRSAH
jgi:hypothetical protein